MYQVINVQVVLTNNINANGIRRLSHANNSAFDTKWAEVSAYTF